MMTARRDLRVLCGIGVIACFIGAGVTFATIPAADGVIFACYSKTDKKLRVIDNSIEAANLTRDPSVGMFEVCGECLRKVDVSGSRIDSWHQRPTGTGTGSDEGLHGGRMRGPDAFSRSPRDSKRSAHARMGLVGYLGVRARSQALRGDFRRAVPRSPQSPPIATSRLGDRRTRTAGDADV